MPFFLGFSIVPLSQSWPDDAYPAPELIHFKCLTILWHILLVQVASHCTTSGQQACCSELKTACMDISHILNCDKVPTSTTNRSYSFRFCNAESMINYCSTNVMKRLKEREVQARCAERFLASWLLHSGETSTSRGHIGGAWVPELYLVFTVIMEWGHSA